jgi:succinate dehydrogenase / fumarate reductase cytochrome b subunit
VVQETDITRQKGRGSLYRGTASQWAWIAHRIAGVALFAFLLLHIADVSMARVSPGAYNAVLGLYHHWIMGIAKFVLVGGVLVHGLNGLRLIIVDAWPRGARYNAIMLAITAGIVVVGMSAFAVVWIPRVFGGAS